MQNFKSTSDSLKQIFEGFGREPSLGAPDFIIGGNFLSNKKKFSCNIQMQNTD